VQLNEKDIQDAIILLIEHDIGDSDKDEINAPYVSSILAKEWGFYYTVITNLSKVEKFLQGYKVLSDSDKTIVSERIQKITSKIEAAPKTMGWKMRARVGPSVKWYNLVEEVQRDTAS
jgi:hypothetical protein